MTACVDSTQWLHGPGMHAGLCEVNGKEATQAHPSPIAWLPLSLRPSPRCPTCLPTAFSAPFVHPFAHPLTPLTPLTRHTGHQFEDARAKGDTHPEARWRH